MDDEAIYLYHELGWPLTTNHEIRLDIRDDEPSQRNNLRMTRILRDPSYRSGQVLIDFSYEFSTIQNSLKKDNDYCRN